MASRDNDSDHRHSKKSHKYSRDKKSKRKREKSRSSREKTPQPDDRHNKKHKKHKKPSRDDKFSEKRKLLDESCDFDSSKHSHNGKSEYGEKRHLNGHGGKHYEEAKRIKLDQSSSSRHRRENLDTDTSDRRHNKSSSSDEKGSKYRKSSPYQEIDEKHSRQLSKKEKRREKRRKERDIVHDEKIDNSKITGTYNLYDATKPQIPKPVVRKPSSPILSPLEFLKRSIAPKG